MIRNLLFSEESTSFQKRCSTIDWHFVILISNLAILVNVILQMALSNQLSNLKQLLERLQHDMKKKEEDLDAKDAEIEEKQCLATSYFNALEVRFSSFILFPRTCEDGIERESINNY